jgi:hypothetical protein
MVLGCVTVACAGKTTPPMSGDGGGGSDSGGGVPEGGTADGGGPLQWYLTCGDPVCEGPVDSGPVDAGPPCPSLGSPCASKGQTCGTRNPAVACGAILVCDDHDPAINCPISTAKYKQGITYVDDAALAALHDEALATRLATYRYTGDVSDAPDAPHLGFILEDQPRSPAVDRLHDRVDLYGYLSMTLAAVQVQEKEIAALRQELEATRRTCRGKR